MTGEEYLELGQAYIRERNWESALNALLESQKLFETIPAESVPPALFSLLGLSYAMARNKIESGLTYCQRALEEDGYQPDFYYHLGLVYLKAGEKQKAISAFRKGLKIDPNHSGIWFRIAQLGFRKRPILPFLPRQHFLNKYIGMWLTQPRGQRKPPVRRFN